jgi:ribosomal protein L40E
LKASDRELSASSQFCARCGAQIPTGAAFCPKCGAPAQGAPAGQQAGASAPPYDYSRRRHEKQEKQEKQEKGEKNEKGRGGDLTGAVTGGMILIWLGLIFFLSQNNYITSGNWWAYLLMGIGAILIIQGVIRFGMSRRPFIGSFIGGTVLLIIGFSSVQGFTADLWPLVLVAIGVAVLLSAIVGRQRRPAP